MIRGWLGPLALALVLGIATFYITLVQTPRAIMAAAMTRLARGGVNQFTHAPLAHAGSNTIVRPSPDLAYSSCPLDLSAGPVPIRVPAMPAAYWSLSVFDARTDVAFVRNNVDTNGQPIAITVAREDQTVAPDATAVRVKGDKAVALIRILVDDRARFPEIDAARKAAVCGKPEAPAKPVATVER